MDKLHELRRKRAGFAARMKELALKEADLPEGEGLPAEDVSEFDAIKVQIAELDGRLQRLEAAIAADASSAAPVDGDAEDGAGAGDEGAKFARMGVTKAAPRVPAAAETKLEKGLVVAGCLKMLAAGGNMYTARQIAAEVYKENHPVTKALQIGEGSAGGFVVPPDFVMEVIELLRPQVAVRSAGPREIAMPRGTMTLPRQSQAATAGYGAELAAIRVSQQSVDQVIASYKKLTALVPIGNDLLRYSDPAMDAIVRDDLVKVIARAEDLAFIRSDGTSDSPKGLRYQAQSSNILVANTGFVSTGTLTQSQLISNLAFVSQDLGSMVNTLMQENVSIQKPAWIMSPRTFNYLANIQNGFGSYVYQEQLSTGKLLGIPYFLTTQIPNNLTVGANSGTCSEIYLAEMSDVMVFDSMKLEIAVSREATYTDSLGNSVSTFQQDQTLMRAIAEHDLQVRHSQSVVVMTGVTWSPSIG